MVPRPGIIIQGNERIVLGRVVLRATPALGGAMVMAGSGVRTVRFVMKLSAVVRKGSHVIRKLCYGTIETLGDLTILFRDSQYHHVYLQCGY
jgi:hypothetical protein